VLIGTRVNGGQRVETTVRADTSEMALKSPMARELSPMKPHYFLHIHSKAGQAAETFSSLRQWTYILSTFIYSLINNASTTRVASVRPAQSNQGGFTYSKNANWQGRLDPTC
jgi:hypothetical protein